MHSKAGYLQHTMEQGHICLPISLYMYVKLSYCLPIKAMFELFCDLALVWFHLELHMHFCSSTTV